MTVQVSASSSTTTTRTLSIFAQSAITPAPVVRDRAIVIDWFSFFSHRSRTGHCRYSPSPRLSTPLASISRWRWPSRWRSPTDSRLLSSSIWMVHRTRPRHRWKHVPSSFNRPVKILVVPIQNVPIQAWLDAPMSRASIQLITISSLTIMVSCRTRARAQQPTPAQWMMLCKKIEMFPVND